VNFYVIINSLWCMPPGVVHFPAVHIATVHTVVVISMLHTVFTSHISGVQFGHGLCCW